MTGRPPWRSGVNARDMAVDGATGPAESDGEPEGGAKLLVGAASGKRRQVGVPKRGDVDRALEVVGPPADNALDGDGHREERVRDAGVAPVEDQVAAVAGVDGACVRQRRRRQIVSAGQRRAHASVSAERYVLVARGPGRGSRQSSITKPLARNSRIHSP